MTVRLNAIDEEIRDLERRIADDRKALANAVTDVGHRMREKASSPAALVAAAGIGFVAGRLVFRPGPPRQVHVAAAQPPSKLGGLLGLLAAGLSMMQPGGGGAGGGLARWAARKWLDARHAKRQTTNDATVVAPVSTTVTTRAARGPWRRPGVETAPAPAARPATRAMS